MNMTHPTIVENETNRNDCLGATTAKSPFK